MVILILDLNQHCSNVNRLALFYKHILEIPWMTCKLILNFSVPIQIDSSDVLFNNSGWDALFMRHISVKTKMFQIYRGVNTMLLSLSILTTDLKQAVYTAPETHAWWKRLNRNVCVPIGPCAIGNRYRL